MISTAIEKAADAILALEMPDEDHFIDWLQTWCDDDAKKVAATIARAAIAAYLEASMEPNEEIIIAGDQAICDALNNDRAWMLSELLPTPAQLSFKAMRKAELELVKKQT